MSQRNGKVSSGGGNYDSGDGAFIDGSYTIPVKESYGVQFDSLYTYVDDAEFYGVGGHIFWRNNEIALLGLSGGAIFGETVDSLEIAVEAEYYFESITLGGKIGYASIIYDQPVPFIDTDRVEEFGQVFVSYYPLEELALSVSAEHRFENFLINFDAEYDLPIQNWTAFCSISQGEHDYDQAIFGLRYYFGSEKPLQKRHRRDDSPNAVHRILSGVGTYGAEYNKRGNEYLKSQQSSGSFQSFGVTQISHSVSVGDSAIWLDNIDSLTELQQGLPPPPSVVPPSLPDFVDVGGPPPPPE